jgi:hypothetical protein
MCVCISVSVRVCVPVWGTHTHTQTHKKRSCKGCKSFFKAVCFKKKLQQQPKNKHKSRVSPMLHPKQNKKTMRKAIASSLPLSVCFPLECVGFQTSLLCSFPCFLFSTPPDHPNAPPASPTSPDTHNTRTSQTHTHSPTTQTDTHTHTHQRRWGTLPPTRDCPSLSSWVLSFYFVLFIDLSFSVGACGGLQLGAVTRKSIYSYLISNMKTVHFYLKKCTDDNPKLLIQNQSSIFGVWRPHVIIWVSPLRWKFHQTHLC